MSKKKKISQKEFIFQYYKDNPHKDIKHDTIISTVTKEWIKISERPFADPDRAIRKLYEEGRLIKVKKGVYRYDPDYVAAPQSDTFPAAIRKKIFEKDRYRCVICGQGSEQGFEIHADHIKPRSMGGQNTIENGQTLCSPHNMLKKNLGQTETGKKMFIRLYELAKKQDDKKLENFTKEILEIYKKHNINGHIDWDE
jgi:5-methylcytosine-specific restriction endonuclease McrA